MKRRVQLTLSFALLLFQCVSSQVTNNEFAYIVVGAGSAGSTVAGGLAKKVDGPILLVDAGGDDTDPNIWDAKGYFSVAFGPTYNWGYTTVSQTNANNKEVSLPRGRVWGGSSSINGMALVQGNPADFDEIAKVTRNRSWKWKSLAKYRKNLEQSLGGASLGAEQEGAWDFIAAAASVGISYNSDGNSGKQAGICPNFQMGTFLSPTQGIRNTPFNKFVRPLLGNSKLQLLGNHHVDKLNIDPITKKVTGISCTNLRTSATVVFYAKKEIIVSAGTYNTPKLLMLSGIGPADILGEFGIDVIANISGVGKNLRDHYGVATYWASLLPPNAPFAFQTPVLNVFGPEKSGPTSFQYEISGTYGSVVPLRSKSVGYVSIRSKSPEDSPIIDPNILSEPSDISDLVTGLKTFILPFLRNFNDAE